LIANYKNEFVRLDVLINGEKAYNAGNGLVEKLKELIPRQQLKVPQAAFMAALKLNQ
jgi:GTP-binding protein LepA